MFFNLNLYVAPIKGTLIVNTGHTLQIISNGLFNSIEHHVINHQQQKHDFHSNPFESKSGLDYSSICRSDWEWEETHVLSKDVFS